jgi:fused signal recognition particle receptor
VILVAGVNGVGKTTTIGTLAALQVAGGSRVLLVAADTFRAAAVDQLERWGGRVGADVIRQAPGTDPAAVVVDGLRAARARKSDVVFIDTAGRLHTKVNLMEELRKIRRVIDRECPGAPHETLLVLDATTGQNGLQQARIFKEVLDVTGVVLTKMDGTARGGIAVAVAADLGLPIRYLALGERAEDLARFDPEEFIDALLSPDRNTPEATTGSAGSPEGRWPT